MSQNVQTPPTSSAPAEASNRVRLGLSNRLLARPEIGALIAAIVIFIFFWIAAPAFRSVDSLATVLYQSVHDRHRRRRRRHADDRRRVRPVRRRARDHGRSRELDDLLELGINLWVGRCRLAGLLPADRIPQRVPGHADRHPQLPHHARHVLRPAGRQPRRDEARHRLGLHAGHLQDRRLRLAVQGLRVEFHDRRDHDLDTDHLVVLLRRARRMDPAADARSATGSSPSVATPRAPERSASR